MNIIERDSAKPGKVEGNPNGVALLERRPPHGKDHEEICRED
jgi:hypothetical protein